MSIHNMDIVAEKKILQFPRDAMILHDAMILRLKIKKSTTSFRKHIKIKKMPTFIRSSAAKSVGVGAKQTSAGLTSGGLGGGTSAVTSAVSAAAAPTEGEGAAAVAAAASTKGGGGAAATVDEAASGATAITEGGAPAASATTVDEDASGAAEIIKGDEVSGLVGAAVTSSVAVTRSSVETATYEVSAALATTAVALAAAVSKK
jgi:hypothetical protein